MKTIKAVLVSLVAVLLLVTPPAQAAKKKTKKAHAHKSAKAAHAAKPAAKAKDPVSVGLAYLDKQDYLSAIGAFKKAAIADKKSSAAFFLLGYAHYQKGFQSGNPETASRSDALETVNAYTTALALDPSLKQIAAPYRLYHSMALSYEALDSKDRAIEYYRKAFEAAPSNPMLPLYAARLRFRMGDFDKAASNLSLALRKAKEQGKQKDVVQLLKTSDFFSPMMKDAVLRKIASGYDRGFGQQFASASRDTGELRDSLRNIDQRRQIVEEEKPLTLAAKQMAAADEEYHFRHYRDAIDAYNETLQINQKSPTLSATQLSLVYERMGTAYNRLGVSNGAIKALQYSLQEMPFNAAAHYQLALAYSVSGKFTQSMHALSEALKNAPSEGERRKLMLLAKTDSELDPIRDMPGFQSVISEYNERLQAAN